MNGGNGSASCGCGSGSTGVCGCTGIEVLTPASSENAPGQSSLAWRAGTHDSFKRTMLAGLARNPALRALTTRDDDDPSIALIDAWSTTLDVLTFYQERIANENYLRTAKERRSILEMARAIGYELAPGVSASTHLAFALETAPTAPLSATVPAGTKVQSIPAQDERPQLYETASDLSARGSWNALPVRWQSSTKPVANATDIFLAGISTSLQTGDALLIVGRERIESPTDSAHWDFRRVRAIELVTDPLNASRNYTRVVFDKPLSNAPAQHGVHVYGLRQRVGLFGGNAPDFAMMPESTRKEISASAASSKASVTLRAKSSAAGSIFNPDIVDAELEMLSFRPEWPHFNIGYQSSRPESLDTLFLDNAYKAAVKHSWLVIATDEGSEQLYRIEAAAESGLAQFAISGKSTRLKLSGDTHALVNTFWTSLREAAVFLQTEEFALAERPLQNVLPIGANTVDLEVVLEGDDALLPERTLIVSGEDAITGAAVAEVVALESSSTITNEGEATRTRLVLASALTNSYKRTSAIVHANIVEANHGETMLRRLPNGSFVTEVLGSGDGSQTFQAFYLKQKPMTFVSAANASGRATSLRVRVDGVLWKEVPSFYRVAAEDRVYVVRLADDGKVKIQFGDGVNGARLPTGIENVTALYRVGTGLEGLVAADQLTLLMSRPLGVKEVRNPLPSTGAENPEEFANARENAPLTVLALDRVVSLGDYENFARAFAGIGKAKVSWLWTGEKQTVHLTIGLADGSSPTNQSRPLQDLRAAIDGARHALRPVIADGFVAKPFSIYAKIAVDPDYESEAVLKSVTTTLLQHFAFSNRTFAQDVTESEAIAIMQRVPGVVFVDLDELNIVSTGIAAVAGRLESRPARVESSVTMPAELLTLAETDIHLTARAP